MYRGEFEYSVDDKGRVLLPIKHREALGDVVVLVRGASGQINVYAKPDFEATLEKAKEFEGNIAFRNATRYLSAANDCDVDRQGRIVIPPVLRRHAKLGNEVIIVGNDDHVEIWNPDAWGQAYDSWVAAYRLNGDDYAEMLRAGLRL